MTFRRNAVVRSASVVLVGAVAVFAVACGSSSSTSDGSGSAPDTATGAECDQSLEKFLCTGDSNPSAWCCPPSYDGSVAALPACNLGERQLHGSCAGAPILDRAFGTHAIQCYYAASTFALVGAAMEDDVASFCGETSSVRQGGDLSAATSCSPAGLTTETCPHVVDAGGDASDGG